MNDSVDSRVRSLRDAQAQDLLRDSRKGLEKESLRVSRDGTIAQSRHPKTLGSALCHPWITTDYSEALLEFITPPYHYTGDAVSVPRRISTGITYHNIGDELLWATSMPCIVGGDASIPIAEYGELQRRLDEARLPPWPRLAVRPRYAGHCRHPLQLLVQR
ncbi:MAG: hypothetical protein U5L11_04890 [Arhodomonas sp.]|nr:hypothetical protein [Arhodomonas sp.]